MTYCATDEAHWSSWLLLQSLPAVPRPTGTIVVVSAHPDDEVLGAGGLITALAGTSARLTFVTVTDGEASHPGSSAVSPVELGKRRSLELIRALEVLRHPTADITRLGLPDSDLFAYERDVSVGIEHAVSDADLVVCPAAADGHIDHATVGRLTLRACEGRVPVWQFPIWAWHWTQPGAAGLCWERARRFEITADERLRKRAALACFATQVSPLPGEVSGTTILPPAVLAHFDRPYEVFLT